MEKGYKAADDFFLHPEIRGKLAGYDAIISSEDKLWAGLSMEEGNKVIRRHQSDGSRYDSLAINGATTLPSHLLPLYRYKDSEPYIVIISKANFFSTL